MKSKTLGLEKQEPEKLSAGDALAYRELMLEGYRLHPEAFTATVEDRVALPISWWAARLGDSSEARSVVFGVRCDGDLCGVAGLEFHAREKIRHKAKLYGLYVRQAHRGSGLGARLIDAVMEEAKRRNRVSIVQLSVTEGNQAARELYERNGFAEYGNEPCAIALDGGYASKIYMWRKL